MEEDSQLTNPKGPIIDMTEQNQEKEFHTPTLGANQVNEEGGVDAIEGDDDPSVGKIDLMLGVVMLYTDVPGFYH